MSFEDSLQRGQVGESLIAKWLRSRGWFVLPIYEKEIGTGKGPRLFTPNETLIGTDMFAFNHNGGIWIESKHKTAFSEHRITGNWTTGIDLHHYEHYCRINDETPWPVWLLFLHRGGQAKDSPPDSPTGLYGGSLDYLRAKENHRHENWGKTGMVYWARQDLKLIATLEEVINCASEERQPLTAIECISPHVDEIRWE